MTNSKPLRVVETKKVPLLKRVDREWLETLMLFVMMLVTLTMLVFVWLAATKPPIIVTIPERVVHTACPANSPTVTTPPASVKPSPASTKRAGTNG